LFSKILVPIDGSPQAHNALIKALEIAKIHGSEVEILHVTTFSEEYTSYESSDNVSSSEAISPPEWIAEYIENVRENDENMLNETLKYAKHLAPELNIKTKLLTGKAAETIIAEADEGEFDLIVIGSRGLGGLRELVLGTVCRNVVNGVKIPVLVVK
jgi:nucleotide-binding universal stress UspA family protein